MTHNDNDDERQYLKERKGRKKKKKEKAHNHDTITTAPHVNYFPDEEVTVVTALLFPIDSDSQRDYFQLLTIIMALQVRVIVIVDYHRVVCVLLLMYYTTTSFSLY